MVPDKKNYGLHLMIDGYGADPTKLADVGLLFRVLNDLPGLIGMQKLGVPQIGEVTDPGGEGISGLVLIKESHISVHTYPKKDFVSADVYSCRAFDYAAAVTFIKEAFGIGNEIEIFTTVRGRRFPVDNLHD